MRIALFIALALVSTSCTHIMFTTPQPAGEKHLDAFPSEFHGSFIDTESPGDTFIIKDEKVTFIERMDHEVPVSQLEQYPQLSFRNGKLYDSENPRFGGITYQEIDSVIHYTVIDRSSLGVSDSLILTRLHDYLIVNLKTEEENRTFWDVAVVEISKKGELIMHTIGDVKTPDSEEHDGPFDGDLATFNKITPYTRLREDTYYFEPTKSEFHKLVKKGLFGTKDVFQKIN